MSSHGKVARGCGHSLLIADDVEGAGAGHAASCACAGRCSHTTSGFADPKTPVSATRLFSQPWARARKYSAPTDSTLSVPRSHWDPRTDLSPSCSYTGTNSWPVVVFPAHPCPLRSFW